MSNTSWLPILTSYVALAYIKLWGTTNRFDALGKSFTKKLVLEQPLIFCFWHSRQLFPLYYYNNTQASILVSQSRDGEFITQVIYRCGLVASRGSSSNRGAGGLRELIHHLKTGRSVVITPDGPRGPREVVQLGIIQLARLSGVPIVPVAWSASRCIRFEKSWDKFMVPLPFGAVRQVVGEPVHVSNMCSKEQMEEKRAELQNEMRRITQLADEILPEDKRIQPGSDCR